LTEALPASSRSDRLDATLWLVLCLAVLWAVPVGFVSNDGLWHSRKFADGSWSLNPNHLLLEPLGALWQGLWARLDPAREGFDALKLLAALAGALAVALFRLRVVAFVATRRWVANYGTAGVAASSVFLRLWVSDEIHMIQMPCVVAFTAEAVRLIVRPSLRDGARAGVALAFAALCFVSNVLLGVSLGLYLLFRRQSTREPTANRNAVLGFALSAFLVLAPAYTLATLHARGAARSGDALSWLSHGRFGAASPLARGESGYGLEMDPRGLALGGLRALYGAASALVDLSPLAAAVRDRSTPPPAAVCGALAFLAAASGTLLAYRRCLRARPASSLAVVGNTALVMTVPLLVFGFLWSNSDDQFYLALAPTFGLLAAVAATELPRPGLWLALGLAALTWNLADVTRGRLLYPRAERIADVETATAGACLVVFPGFDEAELALELSASSTLDRLSIAALATSLPPGEGLRELDRRIEACMRRGGPVALIDLFDVAPERNPWRYLARLGYSHAEVLRSLRGQASAAATTLHGPFSVRTLG